MRLLAITSCVAAVMLLFFLAGGGAKAQDAYCTVVGTTLTCTGINIANCPSGNFIYLNSSGVLACQPVGITLAVPSEFSAPTTPTISGTITVGKNSQSANTFYGSPDGTAGVNTNRAITATDIAAALGSAGAITSSNLGAALTAAGVVENSGPATTYTIAQMLAISAPAAGMIVYVSDTVGSAAPAWHGTIAAGGSTTVKGYAFYTGSAWEWQ